VNFRRLYDEALNPNTDKDYIGGEIWLAVRQGKDEDFLMDKQNGVLASLNSSASETTRGLKVLNQEMEQQHAASYLHRNPVQRRERVGNAGPRRRLPQLRRPRRLGY
jgi:hypothetical protein